MFTFLAKTHKKILSGKYIACMLVAIILLNLSFLPISVAHAQRHFDDVAGPSEPVSNTGIGGGNTASPAAQQVSKSDAPPDGWVEGAIFKAVNGVIVGLGFVMLGITEWFLWAAGLLLKGVIEVSVLDVHKYLDSVGVRATWQTFRDMANMLFIFILLYIAIGTILGLGNIDLKKMVIRVVIIALLLNFSMFFTKLAIDASNIVTIGFYNQIIHSTRCAGGTPGNIGEAFTCELGVSSFLSASETNVATPVSDWNGVFKRLVWAFLGSMFMFIAAFIILGAGILFIARLVILVFLVALSPLAFASMALPSDDYSNKWKKPLIANCIFAPAYMALTWAVLQIAQAIVIDSGGSLSTAVSGITNGDITQADPAAGGVILNYAILISLMIASLLIAKEVGAFGASGTIKFIDKSRGWAQGKLGRGALRAVGAPKWDDKFGKSQFGQTTLGRNIRDLTTKPLTKAEFGSGKSISKIDKELKKDYEGYAKKQGENVGKEADKATDVRKNWIAIMEDKYSTNEQKIEAHKKIIEAEEKRTKDADVAIASAKERKAFEEAAQLEEVRRMADTRASNFKGQLKTWETIAGRGEKIEQPDKEYIKPVRDDVKDEKNTTVKVAKLAEAARRDKSLLQKTAGKFGIDIGEKSTTGKVFKFVYGEIPSARKETVKKLREEAKKGKKNDLKSKVKKMIEDEGGSKDDLTEAADEL